MLGRKPQGDLRLASTAEPTNDTKGPTRKRKWKEELSDESKCEVEVTKADMDAWRKTIAEEEKQERLEREKREQIEREADRKRRQAEELQRRRLEEEDAQAQRDAEEAQKAAKEAETERRRQEEELAPPGPLPPDMPGTLPPGMRAEKVHLYKTAYCKRWEQGNCNFGAACHFAHGERELRGRPPKGSPAGTMSVPLPEDVPKPTPNRGTMGNVLSSVLQNPMPPAPVPPPPVPLPQQPVLPCNLQGPNLSSMGLSSLVSPMRNPVLHNLPVQDLQLSDAMRSLASPHAGLNDSRMQLGGTQPAPIQPQQTTIALQLLNSLIAANGGHGGTIGGSGQGGRCALYPDYSCSSAIPHSARVG